MQRKPSLKRVARSQIIGAREAALSPREAGIPRWIVVAGLVIYCSLIWGIALEFGASALKRFLPDNDTMAQAKQAVPNNDASGR